MLNQVVVISLFSFLQLSDKGLMSLLPWTFLQPSYLEPITCTADQSLSLSFNKAKSFSVVVPATQRLHPLFLRSNKQLPKRILLLR